jgi:ankyrin repeat protein
MHILNASVIDPLLQNVFDILKREKLKQSICMNSPSSDHQIAPLHYAARYDHTDIVRLLIAHGADLNIHADDGLTPLHYCAR